uniref:Protein transport protein sec16 n=1 Tax=Eptatretus burgeri TaxID=7764 RepID=A0A8C4QKH2_EPTBU
MPITETVHHSQKVVGEHLMCQTSLNLPFPPAPLQHTSPQNAVNQAGSPSINYMMGQSQAALIDPTANLSTADISTVSMFFRDEDEGNVENVGEQLVPSQLHPNNLNIQPLATISPTTSPVANFNQSTSSEDFSMPSTLDYTTNQEVPPKDPRLTMEQSSMEYQTSSALVPGAAVAPRRPISAASSGSGVGTQQLEPRIFLQQEKQVSARSFFQQVYVPPVSIVSPPQESPPTADASSPLSPSPPKPTGHFQPSKNSSFEPFRGPLDSTVKRSAEQQAMFTNMEQPPENQEIPPAGNRASALRHQLSRSRIAAASPTTLWAQPEPPALDVVLAPPAAAFPTSSQSEVIQPPEDEGRSGTEPLGNQEIPMQSVNVHDTTVPEATPAPATSDKAKISTQVPTQLVSNMAITSALLPPTGKPSSIVGVDFTLPQPLQTTCDGASDLTNSGATFTTPSLGLTRSTASDLPSTVPVQHSQRGTQGVGQPLDLTSRNGQQVTTSTAVAPQADVLKPALGDHWPRKQDLPSASQSRPTFGQLPPPELGSQPFTGVPDLYPPVPHPQHLPSLPQTPVPYSEATYAPQVAYPTGAWYPGYGSGEVYGYGAEYRAGPYVPYSGQYPSSESQMQTHYYQDQGGRPETFQRCPSEPERTSRPSSRASQHSDRPLSRHGGEEVVADGSGHDPYAAYYTDRQHASHYGYNRWYSGETGYDYRYHNQWPVDNGRYSQQYERSWYDYSRQRELYRDYYGRRDVYANNWQYDPRYDHSFETDLSPVGRNHYPDEFDQRSIHSEHSTHSHRSSFSSHSQQSQVYPVDVNTFSELEQDYDAYPPACGEETSYLDNQFVYTEGSWQGTQASAPEKFPVPHICVRFGPGGHLVRSLPNMPADGQPALVEIHSLEIMLQQTPEQEELRNFPGPLTKTETHKGDVLLFAQGQATRCLQDSSLLDRQSAALLWQLLVLLCRQNGTVVGTDIAELLMQNSSGSLAAQDGNLIDFAAEAVTQSSSMVPEKRVVLGGDASGTFSVSGDALNVAIDRFRELLTFGRKKDALESAMRNSLWGHALLLASKMDGRTHANVMTRFANSLPMNDPLQTIYQLLSGRMPAASTSCCDERWGHWRPHLAMVLSNLTGNPDLDRRTITTLGDTLASKGLLDAAHFCYLMAQLKFESYGKRSAKLVLLGANHSLPLQKFALSEAIQRTEVYEYVQALGGGRSALPAFQTFKFLYACRLAEYGLVGQALQYCEVIGHAVLSQPALYSGSLISQLVNISGQLKSFDPALRERPDEEQFLDPEWLQRLQHLDAQFKAGVIPQGIEADSSYNASESSRSNTPEPMSVPDGTVYGYPPHQSGIASDTVGLSYPPMDPVAGNRESFMTTQSNTGSPYTQQFSQVGGPPGIPAFVPGQVADGFFPQTASHYPVPDSLSRGPDGQPVGSPRVETTVEPAQQPLSTSQGRRHGGDMYEDTSHASSGHRSRNPSESSTHSGGAKSLSRKSSDSTTVSTPVVQPIMAQSKEMKGKIVFDKQLGRWVNRDEPAEDESKAPPPPPTSLPYPSPAVASDVQDAAQGPVNGSELGPPSGVNRFSRRAGPRGRYVDVMNTGRSNQANAPALPPPSSMFPPLVSNPISNSSNLFVPSAPVQNNTSQVGCSSSTDENQQDEVTPEDQSQRSCEMTTQPQTSEPAPGSVPFYNPSQFAQVWFPLFESIIYYNHWLSATDISTCSSLWF